MSSWQSRALRRFRRRLRADGNKGSAAMEFAMVAPVFFLLLMGTIEAGVIFFAQSALQNAVNDTARLVRTGQSACYTTDSGNCQAMTQTSSAPRSAREVSVAAADCSWTPTATATCNSTSQAYPAGFTGVTNSSPLDAAGNLPTLTAFNTGNACDVVLVRAFYRWPVFTPGLSFFLANMSGNYHLLATRRPSATSPIPPRRAAAACARFAARADSRSLAARRRTGRPGGGGIRHAAAGHDHPVLRRGGNLAGAVVPRRRLDHGQHRRRPDRRRPTPPASADISNVYSAAGTILYPYYDPSDTGSAKPTIRITSVI